MQIYNSLTDKKEEFVPRDDNKVKMFVCGPTVYDYIHIGNGRTFTVFDAITKYLRYRGFDVEYIQNITDIDDKIIARAKDANTSALELARHFEKIFVEDTQNLGINSVSRYARATDHIQQVVQQVKALIDRGFAYKIDGDGYYFDLLKFPNYGKLSGRTAQMADDAVSRIDDSSKKKNPGDFCLWKFSKEGPGEDSSGAGIASEPFWETELGKGRPGWHIEDTAITQHYFGPQYDYHGGGQDLIFPHHEAEIAQQESASGKEPFVKYWSHVAFLVNKEAKMSKSSGNFSTVHDLLKQYSRETLRFYLLSAHYRQSLDFSEKALHQSQAATTRLFEFSHRLRSVHGKDSENIDEILNNSKEKIIGALDDDFNTPAAFGHIFDMMRAINPLLVQNGISKESAVKIYDFLKELNTVLGIIPAKEIEIPEKVQKLIEEREQFRAEKNWEESDKIRAQIEEMGYTIEDTSYGSVVIKSIQD